MSINHAQNEETGNSASTGGSRKNTKNSANNAQKVTTQSASDEHHQQIASSLPQSQLETDSQPPQQAIINQQQTTTSPPPSPIPSQGGVGGGLAASSSVCYQQHHNNSDVGNSFIPPELVDLFEISSFVAAAKPYSKPCFRTKTFVSKDSWIGAIYRRFYGENAMIGAMYIQRIAERLASALKNYKGQVWEPAIRKHTTDFAKGIKVIQETYHDYTDVIPIFSTSLLIVEHSLNFS